MRRWYYWYEKKDREENIWIGEFTFFVLQRKSMIYEHPLCFHSILFIRATEVKNNYSSWCCDSSFAAAAHFCHFRFLIPWVFQYTNRNLPFFNFLEHRIQPISKMLINTRIWPSRILFNSTPWLQDFLAGFCMLANELLRRTVLLD